MAEIKDDESMIGQPSLDVYLAANFTKQGAEYRTWKRRYFILKGTKITYYNKPDDVIEKGKIDLTKGYGVRSKIETMGLGGVQWPSHVHSNLAFGIAVEGRTYYLYGDCEDEVNEWKRTVQRIIEVHGNPNNHPHKDPQGQTERSLSKIMRNAAKLGIKVPKKPSLKKDITQHEQITAIEDTPLPSSDSDNDITDIA